ncbi:MAG: DUF1501 domain-containing protein [Pseudomonadota bacterium]|nr:DUF1501 domain-containing protein [Pseudomonadota bacterium]
MSPNNAARRKFLRTASVVSGSVGAAAAPFALNLASLGSAVAQPATGPYKAIVCLFMYGGNDSSHMVQRTDKTSFDVYTKMRTTGTDPIALLGPGTPINNNAARGSPARLGGITAIAPKFTSGVLGSAENSAWTFGLHPSMPEVATLFGAGRLAIVGNAGPLVAPMTKSQWNANSVPRPRALGSHNDQQSSWQALGPEGVKVGWGGHLGDLVASGNGNATFTSISVSGNAVFCAGDTVFQYQVGGGGAVQIAGLSGNLFNSSSAAATLKGIVTASNQNLFADEYAGIVKRSVAAQATFQTAFAAGNATAPSQYLQPSTGQNQTNGLAQQLQTVARIIAARGALGANRQIFFVSMGGFDTHSNQNAGGADLLARVSHAIGYFDTALANLGGADLRSNVTLFTASDFGRTLNSNGDGTDHGWGASHFVSGGAVNGGEIYGRFPEFGPQGIDSIGDRYLPVLSVDQIGATVGKWFGASSSQLNTIFPNLPNFTTADLGFLKAL